MKRFNNFDAFKTTLRASITTHESFWPFLPSLWCETDLNIFEQRRFDFEIPMGNYERFGRPTG